MGAVATFSFGSWLASYPMFGHFAQKLADAQKASTQATQASNVVNLPASADSEAAAA